MDLLLIIVLSSLELLAALCFAVDKWQARRGGRRIPRKHLLVLLLLGPFLATVAMVLLHHKVRKRRFLIGSVVGGVLRVGMAVAWIELLHFDAGLLAYTSVGGCAWLAALLLQARRGCHCEPSTEHGPGGAGPVAVGRAREGAALRI
ncbi:unnamed protein product [Symbiodinium sp. CCMP2592]|nr:unnamed protein product [Symbiodinium sp. CCMP2592]